MFIEEIVRSCANPLVAEAAVASIGRSFFAQVSDRALSYDMTVGAFTALSISCFLRHGEESELRSVIAAMRGSQQPLLAGLHRILCIMLASGGMSNMRQMRDRAPRMTAQLCAIEADPRREIWA